MRTRTSFSSSGHKKLDALMFIFSFLSSVNLSEATNAGGHVGKTGRESSGLEGRWQTIRYSLGRVVRTGRIRLAAFLYWADTSVSKVGQSLSESSSESY